MPAPFPMPNATNITGIATYANTVTGGWFWSLILVAIFMVTFLVQKNYPTERAFVSSSFLTFLSAIFMFILGLIADQIFVIAFVIMIASFGFLFVRR